jgi:hypothetical protein
MSVKKEENWVSGLAWLIAVGTARARRVTVRQLVRAIIEAHHVAETARIDREASAFDEGMRTARPKLARQVTLTDTSTLENELVARLKAGELKGFSVVGAVIKESVSHDTYVDVKQALATLFPEAAASDPAEQFRERLRTLADKLRAAGIPLRLTVTGGKDSASYLITALMQVASKPEGMGEGGIREYLKKYKEKMGYPGSRAGPPRKQEKEVALAIIQEVFDNP